MVAKNVKENIRWLKCVATSSSSLPIRWKFSIIQLIIVLFLSGKFFVKKQSAITTKSYFTHNIIQRSKCFSQAILLRQSSTGNEIWLVRTVALRPEGHRMVVRRWWVVQCAAVSRSRDNSQSSVATVNALSCGCNCTHGHRSIHIDTPFATCGSLLTCWQGLTKPAFS